MQNRGYGLWRTPLLLGTSVNRIRRISPDRPLRVSHHTSRSCRALLTVPAHGTLDGFSKRCRLLAELPLEPGIIYDERFLELVEHLKYFAHSRVEKTHRPQQDLRCRLHACRLADLLEDYL